jgi:hypothetical protein
LRRGQSPLKIRGRFSLPTVKAGFDLDDENVPAPAILYGGVYVPEALIGVFHEVK